MMRRWFSYFETPFFKLALKLAATALLAFGPSIANAAKFIQNTPDTPTSSTTYFPRATTPGNTVICWMMPNAGGSGFTVTDNATTPNTYSLITSYQNTYGPMFVYYSITTLAATSVTTSATVATNGAFSCFEFSGITGLDSAGTVALENSATSYSMGPVNLTSDGDLIFIKTIATGTVTTPTGYVMADFYGGDSPLFTTATTRSGFTGQVTTDTAGANDSIMVAFKSGCASPTGTAGQIQYITASNQLKYCDGVSWIAMTGSGATNGACSPAGMYLYTGSFYEACNNVTYAKMNGKVLSTCAVGTAGQLIWDYATGKTKFCDGTNWYDTSPTSASLAIIQQTPMIEQNGGNSITASLQYLPTKGNTIIAMVGLFSTVGPNPITAASVTDTAGNTYTAGCLLSAQHITVNSSYTATGVFYAKNINPGTGVFGVTVTPGGGSMGLIAVEAGGLNATAPFDKSATSTSLAANVATGTSGTTAATAFANELAFSAVTMGAGLASVTGITNSSSYTPLVSDAGQWYGPPWWAGYKVLSATAAQSTSWSFGTSKGYTGCIATFH